MGSVPFYWELYRQTSIGEALSDALDEKLQAGEITQELARKVISTFDRAIEKQLKLITPTLKIKGKILEYRFCDDVWMWLLKNVSITAMSAEYGGGLQYEEISSNKPVKVVACNLVKPGARKH